MSWGDPFRQAWGDASPNAQAAARDVARSVERAAGSLSDGLLHVLQLAQFAAQDLERLRESAARPEPGMAAPEMTPLRRAMDDVRQGRVTPDKAEKHLRQALRTVSLEARCAAAQAAGAGSPDGEAERQALLRLNDLRRAVRQQSEAMRDRVAERADASADAAARCRHVGGLAQASHILDRLFLEDKRADDPAAPLPAARPAGEASDA